MSKLLVTLLLLFAILSCAFSWEKRDDHDDHDDYDYDDDGPCHKRICFFKRFRGKGRNGKTRKPFSSEDICASEVPPTCIYTFEALSMFETSLGNDTYLNDDHILLYNNTLDSICTECYSAIYQYFICSQTPTMFDLIRQKICIRNDNGYCLVQFVEIYFNKNATYQDCNVTNLQNCTSDCSMSLSQYEDTLGCCTTSLFQPFNGSYQTDLTDQKFQSCGINLSERCEIPALPSPGVKIVCSILASLLSITVVFLLL